MARARVINILAAGLFMLLVKPAVTAEKVKVLTSIFPLEQFAAAVAGERGDVSLLLPPGAGVHTWQPRPGDILRLASCDLFISVGANLEPWLSSVLRAVPPGRLRVLEVSRGLKLLPAAAEGPAGTEHEHGAWDPHIWLDFDLDLLIVDHIASVLSDIAPLSKAEFVKNASLLKDRLRALDSEYKDELKGCEGKRLIIAGHAAFGYLARRYGLVQTSLFGLSPDAQPGPQQMIKLIALCRAENIRTVFFEESISPTLAEALAGEIGGRVLALNAGHNLTREELRKGLRFFDIMEENLRHITDGLGCRKNHGSD